MNHESNQRIRMQRQDKRKPATRTGNNRPSNAIKISKASRRHHSPSLCTLLRRARAKDRLSRALRSRAWQRHQHLRGWGGQPGQIRQRWQGETHWQRRRRQRHGQRTQQRRGHRWRKRRQRRQHRWRRNWVTSVVIDMAKTQDLRSRSEDGRSRVGGTGSGGCEARNLATYAASQRTVDSAEASGGDDSRAGRVRDGGNEGHSGDGAAGSRCKRTCN
jgi:hypothetical protein